MKDLIIDKEYAFIGEIKLSDDRHNDNCLRVYCNQYPDQFLFQVRTYKPITERGNGKKRDMIANVTLTIKEVEDILEYMKKRQDE
ncbi:MAG: hypothetical protein NWE89_11775 [Candidatus Bathyarchaeota archaeon]|nr:hypothetical protein [Candidatus Bathyarchaeota archaeon]